MSCFSHALIFRIIFFQGVQTSTKRRTFFDFFKPIQFHPFRSSKKQTKFDQTETIQITTIRKYVRLFLETRPNRTKWRVSSKPSRISQFSQNQVKQKKLLSVEKGYLPYGFPTTDRRKNCFTKNVILGRKNFSSTKFSVVSVFPSKSTRRAVQRQCQRRRYNGDPMATQGTPSWLLWYKRQTRKTNCGRPRLSLPQLLNSLTY